MVEIPVVGNTGEGILVVGIPVVVGILVAVREEVEDKQPCILLVGHIFSSIIFFIHVMLQQMSRQARAWLP